MVLQKDRKQRILFIIEIITSIYWMTFLINIDSYYVVYLLIGVLGSFCWYQNRKEKQNVAADTSNRARAEIAKRSAAERRKLAKFLAKNGLNDEKIKSLDPVILNVSWMKSKLDDAREAIGE